VPLYAYEPLVVSLKLEEEKKQCCYFEKLQSFRESPLTHCPCCGNQVQRVLSLFSVPGSLGVESQKNFLEKSQPQASSARQAAKLALEHVCQAGCKHS
jgi:predicted nucleic acid-binding Zn ribbon protein